MLIFGFWQSVYSFRVLRIRFCADTLHVLVLGEFHCGD